MNNSLTISGSWPVRLAYTVEIDGDDPQRTLTVRTEEEDITGDLGVLCFLEGTDYPLFLGYVLGVQTYCRTFCTSH